MFRLQSAGKAPDHAYADCQPVCKYVAHFFETGEHSLASDMADCQGKLRNTPSAESIRTMALWRNFLLNKKLPKR